jgi:hypothetical protein
MKKKCRSGDINLTTRNPWFCNFHVSNNLFQRNHADHIYPIDLEIKDTTDTTISASYIDIHLNIDSEGEFRTKLYDKRYDFNFSHCERPSWP